jgi:DNA-binding NarL/FixJ family response regulator
MFASKSADVRTTRDLVVCHDHRVTRTVLIVDDHPSFRASARATLEAGGFVVVGEAAAGAAALEAVDKLHPDVVLLDVQLPDMSGFDLCEQLESSAPDAGRPAVVLVSSRDLADYGELVPESCACGFIAKADLSGPAVAALLP